MKRKLISSILACTLFSTLFANVTFAKEISSNNSKILSNNTLSQNTERYTINTLSKGLVQNPDGTLSLSVSQETASKLGISNDGIQKLQQGIASLNTKIKSGELASTKNGTIYSKNDTDFVIQGGVNKSITCWWGWEVWANYNKTNQEINTYTKLAAGYGIGSVASSGVVPLAVILASGGCYYAMIASDLTYNNTLGSNGTVLDQDRWGPYSIYPQ